MRQVLFAGKKPKKCPPLLRVVIANRPAQHWISSFESIENRAHRDRARYLELQLALDLRKCS
jgi:hypothetical protein